MHKICPPVPLTALVIAASATLTSAPAWADGGNDTVIPNNQRLNNGVVANVYTVQHQAGCTNDVRINPQLQLAAQRHTADLLGNRNLDGDNGSDGSTPQDRANAAGFHGQVAETVAINQSLAISGNDLINRWYHDPGSYATMANCANSQLGVWSENSPDRTVVVAVYGQSSQPIPNNSGPPAASPLERVPAPNVPLNPSPDYDASDEVEFGLNWLPWILRGKYPPPAYPPG